MPENHELFITIKFEVVWRKTIEKTNLTLNSNAPTAIPEAAPVPDNPMKCSLPILLAKSEKPT